MSPGEKTLGLDFLFESFNGLIQSSDFFWDSCTLSTRDSRDGSFSEKGAQGFSNSCQTVSAVLATAMPAGSSKFNQQSLRLRILRFSMKERRRH